MLRMLNQWFGRDMARNASASENPPSMKWLPVIDTDSCAGCNECVDACKQGCLSMEWNFSTLTHPGSCDSDGRCMEVCPYGVIQMGWVEATGDEGVGLWREPEVDDK